MRQMSFSSKKERKDDLLLPLTGINQRLTADHVFAKRAAGATATARISAGKAAKLDDLEQYCSFGVRDEYSGLGIMNPNSSKNQNINYEALKRFIGPKGKRLPNIIVKSDATKIPGKKNYNSPKVTPTYLEVIPK